MFLHLFFNRSDIVSALGSTPGVHIIPKIADFLDPKIIFWPQLKKCPQLKNICPHLPPIIK